MATKLRSQWFNDVSAELPVLYVFAISHYCEKARWALDYLGVDYELRFVAPGEHMKIARSLGAPKTSVPFLALPGGVVQGSADIIDWAEANATVTGRSLTPVDADAQSREIESRIDEIAGVHVRRYYYSEALVEYPETVRPIFTRDLPFPKNLLVRFAWGKIRGAMIARMNLGTEQGVESRDITAGELDWIDGMLADGRRFLVGDTLSRADIAVASLLAPLAVPENHPTYGGLQLPPRVASDVDGWRDRPTLAWVRDLYAAYR